METKGTKSDKWKKRGTLKPSLEGWKLDKEDELEFNSYHLETFLRGMETVQVSILVSTGVDLETFLRGMETRTLVKIVIHIVILETFLRGMETRMRTRRDDRRKDLETFLRGMETPDKKETPYAGRLP